MADYDSKEDTLKHKKNVEKFINKIIDDLKNRASHHDDSKLQKPEKEIFDIYTPMLANLTYNSEEYKKCLKNMQVALNHHYKVNRHHPEYFTNGIKDMTLVDLIEMICDWKAASLRHNNGDIYKSIEVNQKRFGYGNELKQIFINTVNEYFKK